MPPTALTARPRQNGKSIIFIKKNNNRSRTSKFRNHMNEDSARPFFFPFSGKGRQKLAWLRGSFQELRSRLSGIRFPFLKILSTSLCQPFLSHPLLIVIISFSTTPPKNAEKSWNPLPQDTGGDWSMFNFFPKIHYIFDKTMRWPLDIMYMAFMNKKNPWHFIFNNIDLH